MSLVTRSFVHEIAQLAENYGIGLMSVAEAQRTLFVGEFPEDKDQGVWLVEVPSPPPHKYIDAEYPVIDFWARSSHTDQAHALLELVYNSFHRKYSYDTANWHIAFSHALGNIVDVDRDRESGKLFRLSVQFICRNVNNVS